MREQAESETGKKKIREERERERESWAAKSFFLEHTQTTETHSTDSGSSPLSFSLTFFPFFRFLSETLRHWTPPCDDVKAVLKERKN